MSELSPGHSILRVNGEEEPLRAPTILALLAEKEIPADLRGIAVALNGRVVPRADWPATRLAEGDAVEIVLARQGG